jgi:hypothetical protein
VWEQDIGVFPVSFRLQGDEWAHYLRAVFADGEFMPTLGTDGRDPVELGPRLSGPVRSRLLVSPDPGGIRCVVTGEDDGEPDQVEPWRRAAREAVALLGAGNRVFVWEAVIGTSPRTAGLCRLGPLREPVDLGPVRLTPGDVCMRELVTSERKAGFRHGDGGFRHSFPVIASGQVRTYAWGPVAMVAELCLRRACALLSLVTGEVWIPRTPPYELTDREGPLRVPAVFGYVPPVPGPAGQETEWTGEVPAVARSFCLPDWVVQAWAALEGDDGLAQAVDAVYEGMRLEPEHPSLAHLTFVAATEGLGKRFVPDAPCDCIPGCKHEKGVAQKRFRKALKTVMSNREVDQIARIAYDIRSSTGHEGTLFGSERVFGYFHDLSFFGMPDYAVFNDEILGRLRNASREVLARALGRPDQP